jgi:hypothetical protein
MEPYPGDPTVVTGREKETDMRNYRGNDKVGPGIYCNVRELAFRSVDDEARLPGGPEDVWRQVPALAMLLAGPIVGLVFVMFLPLIGFLMLGGLVAGWLARQARPALLAAVRALRPAWEPALAYLGRGKAAAPKGQAPEARQPDEWADEVRRRLEQPQEPVEGEERES